MAQRSSRSTSRLSPSELERQAERDLATQVEHYRAWRGADAPADEVEREASYLAILLRMKWEKLDSPDPAQWDMNLLEELLLHVAPRT